MPPTTPPLVFNYLTGREIRTKHKEAIRQLYGFVKIPIESLMAQYMLGKSTILTYKIQEYAACLYQDEPRESLLSFLGLTVDNLEMLSLIRRISRLNCNSAS